MRRILAIAVVGLVPMVGAAQMKVGSDQVIKSGNPNVVITTSVQAENSIESARRISRDEMSKLVKDGKAVILDVRNKDSYDKAHIKGAVSMPENQLISRLREIPPGKTIITYCACSAEQTAARAVLSLNAHGIKNAAALTGGWNEWSALGLPVEPAKK